MPVQYCKPINRTCAALWCTQKGDLARGLVVLGWSGRPAAHSYVHCSNCKFNLINKKERQKEEYWIVHPVMVSANKIKAKIDAISTLSNLIAELSLCTMWHTTCYMWWVLDVLHVICTQLYLGYLSIGAGDSSWRSEEIEKILNSAFQCNYYYSWRPEALFLGKIVFGVHPFSPVIFSQSNWTPVVLNSWTFWKQN